ncbi:MAG TPA: hypothetical protein PK976_08535, partial [Bacteroidales bacterium]|nr:hypothetical protein [Bacteroidales bacterium]
TLSLLLAGIQLRAQTGEAKATVQIDSTRLMIGQQVRMNISFTHPPKAKIGWGIRGDTLSRQIEIIKKSAIDSTVTPDGMVKRSQNLVITSFDTGYIVVQPIRFYWQLPQDTITQIAETEPILLEVMAMPVDTTQDIRDIKGIQKIGYSWKEILPWIGYALLIAIVAFLIYRYVQYRRGKRKYFLIAPKPKIPAWQIALEALDTLRNKQLWQSGHYKQFYSELTDIFRDYLDNQFQINAPEMVSEEIIIALENAGFDTKLISDCRRMLQTADLVKFARYIPLPDENSFSFDVCRRFVEETMPKPENASEPHPSSPSEMQQ